MTDSLRGLIFHYNWYITGVFNPLFAYRWVQVTSLADVSGLFLECGLKHRSSYLEAINGYHWQV